MALEEYVNAIAEEWGERYFRQTACVPAIWRDERTLYGLQLPDGWWIDIEHPETLGTLARELSSMLSDAGIEHLTTAVLRGEDRSITTEIAQWRRGLRLDDGSEARGLRFGSKWVAASPGRTGSAARTTARAPTPSHRSSPSISPSV